MDSQRYSATMFAVILGVVLSVTGCASAPDLNLDGVDQSIQPRDVVADLQTYRGKRVLWGGTIVNSTNVKTGTELELLVYPLKRDFKPVPLGFNIEVSGKRAHREILNNNVIGFIPGQTDQSIVISAHIDHLGLIPGKEGDNILNGAIDNGLPA